MTRNDLSGLLREFTPSETILRAFKDYVYAGRFEESNNITYQINCLSFYTGTRLNLGNSNIFYIDAGIFVDLVLSSTREGEGSSCSVENDSLVCSNYHFDEDARLSGSLGFYSGVGFRVPISKFELIIKP